MRTTGVFSSDETVSRVRRPVCRRRRGAGGAGGTRARRAPARPVALASLGWARLGSRRASPSRSVGRGLTEKIYSKISQSLNCQFHRSISMRRVRNNVTRRKIKTRRKWSQSQVRLAGSLVSRDTRGRETRPARDVTDRPDAGRVPAHTGIGYVT
jgi:hypothetical protein